MPYSLLEDVFQFTKLFLDLRSFQFHDVFHLDNENRAEDMPTLIDRKVCLMNACIMYWVTFTLLLLSWKIKIILNILAKTLIHFPFCWLFNQDNVFIISNPKSKYPVLQLDLRLYYMHSQLLSPWVMALFLTHRHLVCSSIYQALKSNLIKLFYLQIDFGSSSCHCICDLWRHCFCVCRTTGLIIILFLYKKLLS